MLHLQSSILALVGGRRPRCSTVARIVVFSRKIWSMDRGVGEWNSEQLNKELRTDEGGGGSFELRPESAANLFRTLTGCLDRSSGEPSLRLAGVLQSSKRLLLQFGNPCWTF